MLNQEIALGVLQSSITGAGLVLAIYALIIPLSKRLFERRANASLSYLKEFRKKVEESKNGIEDGKALKDLIDEITQTQVVPDYLRIGMGVTFLGYLVSTLLSYGIVVNWQRPATDDWLSLIFVVTTLVFLIVGLIAIKDIHKIMRQDLEEIRKNICTEVSSEKTKEY